MTCGCNQVLEPLAQTKFTVCDNAGAPAFTERGLSACPQGSTTVNVVFATEKASEDLSFSELAIENLTDANPLLLVPEIISFSVRGFKVALNGAPDSGNYMLRWNVFVASI